MVEEKETENIVDNALENIFSFKKDMTPEEIKEDFIAAGEDQVILSLNKSYELSGSKKMNVLYYALIASITLFCATTSLILSKSTNNNSLQLAGVFSEIGGLCMVAVGLINFSIINDISKYTHEAELFIIEHKPEAMRDLLQKKYENNTGARIKSLFHRKKKEEV